MIKMVNNKLTFFLGIVLIFLTGFVSSLGCCVGPTQETCSTNSEQPNCEQYGGSFFNNDPTCSAQRVCDTGCCILGLDSARMLRGKCQSETLNRGFGAINFLQTTEDCNKYIVSQEWGSCIGLDSYGKKTCKFITRTQCAGQFFSGVLCTSVENSGCNKTDNTVCVGNSVYSVDDCGNRDALNRECNYNSGEVCSQKYVSGGTKAECVDASCLDDFDYTDFVIKKLYTNVPIFSAVTRNQGDSWCVTNGNVPFTDNELERDLNKFGNTISGAAGLKFFSRYCVGGKIVTEACSDGKEGYCSGSSVSGAQITTGTGGKCAGNEWRACLSAENEDDCDKTYCVWFSPELKSSVSDSNLLDKVEISKCIPKVAGGIMDSNAANTVCSMGDFSISLGNKDLVLVSSPKNTFVLFNPEIIAILDYRCSRIADCTGKMSWVGSYGRNGSNGIEYYTSTEVLDQISNRGISFASGKNSGVETVSLLNLYLKGIRPSLSLIQDYELSNYPKDLFPVFFGKGEPTSFEYKCTSRKAPLNENCQKCNEEGSICTKYSCEAIGKNCEFMPSGTCESKADLTSPNITLNCPSSASIGIQQPINISLTTSETSYCRFNLDSALASYDVMPYDFGNDWGMQHKVVLSVPGSNARTIGNASQYPLILKAGTYNVFIRCIDGRSNGDTDPAKLCTFEVPKTPDKNPPVILKFMPITNTPIIYNTTSKKIDMLVNEPVECKWSLKDQNYTLMENSFNCSNTLTFSNTVSGYNCQATLRNVTKNAGNNTKFYIRCKDQPYLISQDKIRDYLKADGYSDSQINSVISGTYSEEQITTFMQNDGYSSAEIADFLSMYRNMETATYSRNTNDRSAVYTLKASQKLEITELSPKNRVTLGPNFADWNLTVKTAGGGYDGITECKWSLSYKNISTAYSAFIATQSTFKSQSINQKTEGDYVLSVICADDSDNTANYTGPLEIRYDRISPEITRVYNDKGNIKITTNEPAMCKFTNLFSVGLGCAFTISHPNLTAMVDSSTTEHSSIWKKGASYFVKCQDFYGNENTLCGTIAKAV